MRNRILFTAAALAICALFFPLCAVGSGNEFEAAVTYATAAGPYNVAVGDFNDDGIPDLAVACASSDPTQGLTVLIGNGDGTFQPGKTYDAGGAGYWVAATDFNLDGRLDLAVANSANDAVSILLGNGDGTFQTPVGYKVGASPVAVAVGDFNRDGEPDLAVANFQGGGFLVGSVSVLLGNGDGTFQPAVKYAAGKHPDSIAVGDFNNDGLLDILVGNASDFTISTLLGKGDGTFEHFVRSVVGKNPSRVAIGDLNGDGRLDAIASLPPGSRFAVSLGNGDGTFQAAKKYSLSSIGGGLAISDFNLDGHEDVAVLDVPALQVSVFLGKGDGNLRAPSTYSTQAMEGITVVSADLNGDGYPDLITTNALSGNISILLNTGQ